MLRRLPSLGRSQKLSLCGQVALGMQHLAEELQLVHRDLAARNLVVFCNGSTDSVAPLVGSGLSFEVKISSPGLSRDIYANEYYTPSQVAGMATASGGNVLCLPVRWMAPECLAAVSEPNVPALAASAAVGSCYTSRSDVWAFAVVVCEIFSLADHLPLARLSDPEILQAGRATAAAVMTGATSNVALKSTSASVMSQQPLCPDVPNELPGCLANLLHRCWAPVPQHRPTFGEITALLSDLMTDMGV
ncbi:unnamed protein product [Protopolystoma xenopodis]|uniref:Protein kinase domain-containing protein n=1 Tax=Protopolystoma xenopodis TaxID=117903 RepID=A0A3S5AAA7_9PLAT|nr:unnamed protein product [Protopolystoma xenopodis]